MLETSKNRCLTVGRQSRDLRLLSRDRSATFSKKFSICCKRRKNVVWQSADGRVTFDHCCVTVQRLFSKFFQIAWNVQKRCMTVGRRSHDLRPLSRDRSATFSKIFLIAWNVEKSLFDSRLTVAWPPTTVAWPFSDFFQKIFWLLETSKKRCLTVGRWSRDLQPLSRDRSATFFKIFPNCLKHLKTLFDGQSTVAWSPTTVAWPFNDFFQIFF